jgi:hypothetical protein
MMQLMLPDYPVIKGDGIRGAMRLCPRVKLKRRVGPPEGGPYPAFLDTSARFGRYHHLERHRAGERRWMSRVGCET